MLMIASYNEAKILNFDVFVVVLLFPLPLNFHSPFLYIFFCCFSSLSLLLFLSFNIFAFCKAIIDNNVAIWVYSVLVTCHLFNLGACIYFIIKKEKTWINILVCKCDLQHVWFFLRFWLVWYRQQSVTVCAHKIHFHKYLHDIVIIVYREMHLTWRLILLELLNGLKMSCFVHYSLSWIKKCSVYLKLHISY